MSVRSTRNKGWRKGSRVLVTEGHHHRSSEPAVLLVDNKTGNVTPVSVQAAYIIADKLVDQAELLEGRTTS